MEKMFGKVNLRGWQLGEEDTKLVGEAVERMVLRAAESLMAHSLQEYASASLKREDGHPPLSLLLAIRFQGDDEDSMVCAQIDVSKKVKKFVEDCKEDASLKTRLPLIH